MGLNLFRLLSSTVGHLTPQHQGHHRVICYSVLDSTCRAVRHLSHHLHQQGKYSTTTHYIYKLITTHCMINMISTDFIVISSKGQIGCIIVVDVQPGKHEVTSTLQTLLTKKMYNGNDNKLKITECENDRLFKM